MNARSLLGQNVNLHLLRLDGIEYRDLKFENGESYCGGWKNNKPEGEGCYTWADGSTYEGSWHAGLKHGWGTYQWPNGAVYQGEWHQGFMQGFGTFGSPDGSRYQGGWQANLKHGLGTKVYANGDVYEGLWRNGKAEGPGRYIWVVRNEYDGEWRGGKMHGQGTLKWRTGERYDGEWHEGQEEGIGVFTWRDGSTYEGFWVGGRKQGAGVFRPAPNKQGLPAAELAARQSSQEQKLHAMMAAAASSTSDVPLDSPTAGQAMEHRDGFQPVAEARRLGSHVFVCDYEAGRLVHEEVLSAGDLEVIFGPLHAQQAQTERRPLRRRPLRRRRREDFMGETIYKGHRSYDLMLNLQLGIRYTITAGSKLPPPAGELGEEAFQEKLWIRFPREGSEVTPPHPSTDFKWKDYCPTAFRALRHLFGTDNGEYILSVCGDQALRELPSPGKSGSVFFISHDHKFVIKTMRKEEIQLLLAMVPSYLAHVRANPDTLLLRFFGVHRVKPSHGNKVRFVVMNNIFRTDAELHRKYDLKGSTLGRTAGPCPAGGAVLKDLDLDVGFHMDPAWRQAMVAQLQRDLGFLEAMHVMDYSLLLGVHFRRDGVASPLVTDKEDAGEEEEEEEGAAGTRGRTSLLGDDSEDLAAAAVHDKEQGEEERGGGPMDIGVDGPGGGAYVTVRVGGGDSAELEVVRSMHSQAIERVSPTKMVERSRSSFGLRSLGWSWRQKQTEQRQVAPVAPAQRPGPASQPPQSAHITPRQQPSLRPTPRGQRSAPLASRLGLPPGGGSEGGHGARSSGALSTRAPPPDQDKPSAVAAGLLPAGKGGGALPGSQQHQKQPEEQQQRQPRQNGCLQPPPAGSSPAQERLDDLQQSGEAVLPPGMDTTPKASAATTPATAMQPFSPPDDQPTASSTGQAAEGADRQQQGRIGGGLISWRSDAVQLPELTMAEMLLTSPSRPQDTTPSTAAAAAGAAGEVGVAAAAGRAEVEPPLRSAWSGERQHGEKPLEAICEVDCAAERAGAAAGRRRPLPEGMPRIKMGGIPTRLPPSTSNNFHSYVDTLSLDPLSMDASSPGEQRESTPTGIVCSRPPQPAGQAAVAADGRGPSSRPLGTAVSLVQASQSPRVAGGPGSAAGAAAAGGSPGTSPSTSGAPSGGGQPSLKCSPGSARNHSMPATRLEVLAAEASAGPDDQVPGSGSKEAAGGGIHGAGSDVASPTNTAAASSGGSSAAAGEGAPTLLQAPPPDGGLPGALGNAPLGRSQSEPAATMAAAAADMARSSTFIGRRDVATVDVASPEAAAMAARVSRTLNRPAHDRLVQDLLSLVRYRILGQRGPSNARQVRTATAVLASRHVVQDPHTPSAAGGGGGSGEEDGPGATLSGPATTPGSPTQLQEQQALPTPAGVSGEAAMQQQHQQQQRLGACMPALAVSLQEPRQVEEVMLFFGVIDFLQEYNMRKRLEHSLKAVVNDGQAISVVEPRAYARRFLAFMDRVFVPREQQQSGQSGQQQAVQQEYWQ